MVEIKGGGAATVANDLTFAEVEQAIVSPWHAGKPFTVGGAVVRRVDEVIRIKIVWTEQSQRQLAHRHDTEMHSAGIADLATDRRFIPFGRGRDFTHQLLFEAMTSPTRDGEHSTATKGANAIDQADDVSKITIGTLLSAMTGPQLWGTVGAVCALIVAAFSIGYSLKTYQIERLKDDLARAEKEVTALKGEKAALTDQLEGITKSVIKKPYKIALLDSPLAPNVYDEDRRLYGGTNSDEIKSVLAELPNIDISAIRCNPAWSDHAQLCAWSPDIILMHYSTFRNTTGTNDYVTILKSFLETMGRCSKAKFVIYSRQFTEVSAKQVAIDLVSIDKRLIGRVETVPVPESSFMDPNAAVRLRNMMTQYIAAGETP